MARSTTARNDRKTVRTGEDGQRRVASRVPRAAPPWRPGRRADCRRRGRRVPQARGRRSGARTSAACSIERARHGSATLRRAQASAGRVDFDGVHRRRRVAAAAMASASAPDPGAQVHHQRRRNVRERRQMPHSSSSSVSGRGMNTPGPTATSTGPSTAVPSRCCSGSRAARRATSVTQWRPRAAGSSRGCSSSLPRGTPSTCAASDSASNRGDATPAAASDRSAFVEESAELHVEACRRRRLTVARCATHRHWVSCSARSAAINASRTPSSSPSSTALRL